MIQAVFEVVVEILFELAVRTPGYALVRWVRGADRTDFESDRVFWVGLLAWTAVVGAVALAVWLALSSR